MSYKEQITVTTHDGRVVETAAMLFSGGEVQVSVSSEGNAPMTPSGRWIFDIRADLRDANGIMELLLVTDALRRVYTIDRLDLTMPYLPYARQDRVMKEGESLALRVFCDLINAQKYDSVTVWDVHSSVAEALLDNVYNVPVETILDIVGKRNLFDDFRGFPENAVDGDRPVLVAPDAGAIKKIHKVAEWLETPYIRADKTRDVKTGAITGTVVYPPPGGFLHNRDYLIVDDICDGGRTFIELARELRKDTNGRIMLYVTHGIFSQGFDELLKHIDHIYCANPFRTDVPAFKFTHLKHRGL